MNAAGSWRFEKLLAVNVEVTGGECRWWLPSLTLLD